MLPVQSDWEEKFEPSSKLIENTNCLDEVCDISCIPNRGMAAQAKKSAVGQLESTDRFPHKFGFLVFPVWPYMSAFIDGWTEQLAHQAFYMLWYTTSAAQNIVSHIKTLTCTMW